MIETHIVLVRDKGKRIWDRVVVKGGKTSKEKERALGFYGSYDAGEAACFMRQTYPQIETKVIKIKGDTNMRTVKSQRKEKQEEQEESGGPGEYQALMAVAHNRAREIATELYGVEKPSRQLINSVYDDIVALNDDGSVDNETTDKYVEAYKLARNIAAEVFGDLPAAELSIPPVLNGVFNRSVHLDDDNDIVEDETDEAKEDLIAAKLWAKEVYGEDSVAATFDAYDRAFDLDTEE